MTDTAKRDARAFERWYAEASPTWPPELQRLGKFAELALKSITHPNTGDLMMREAAKDLAAFNEAYAAFMASKG